VICTVRQVEAIRAGEISALLRPVYRRNGSEMQYRVGGVYPIQPGRFQPHVLHVEVWSMAVFTVGALRQNAPGLYELPDDWPDSMVVAVLDIETAPPCVRCPK
jgi:hypothetical protein